MDVCFHKALPLHHSKKYFKGNVVKPIEKSKSKDIVGQALTDATVNVIDQKPEML